MTRGRLLSAIAFSLGALLIGGCAFAPSRGPSPTRLKALAHNQRGIAEQAGGDPELALAQFNESLRLNGSVENSDGMVVALVNIARTQRLKGDLAAARQAVERGGTLLAEGSDLAPELYFERAKVLLASGDVPGAREWALRAEAAEKGKDGGRMANLVALVLLRQGAVEQALAQLEKARSAADPERFPAEQANSLRLMGEIQLARGDYRRSADCFQRALELDKELCLGRKIAADLRGLGAALARKGEAAGAIGYYRRALQVSLDGGDATLAADDMLRLAELYRRKGEPRLAEEVEGERAKLLK